MTHSLRYWGLAISLAGLLFCGCIGVQWKEYRFKVNADGTGEGTIRYINIVSKDDNDQDVSMKDYGTLISDYLDGKSLEESTPAYHITSKRLLEENGLLVGEMKFTFTSLDSVGFFSWPSCACAPTLFPLAGLDEKMVETNGKHFGDSSATSMLGWENGSKEFYFKTQALDDTAGTRNLLPLYRNWKDHK